MFHLFTHAFFKALLFLCAGSAIHAAHSNDMRDMGGLWRYRPVTYFAMIVAALALAGIPPLAGFWSKDEILLVAAGRNQVLYGVALATAGLTAFYMFRAIFLTFTGEYRGHAEPHREPIIMTFVLLVLTIPTIAIGLWGSPYVERPFGMFLDPAHAHVPAIHLEIAGPSIALAMLGLILAFILFAGGRNPAGFPLPGLLRPLHVLLAQRYFVDHLYSWFAGWVVLGFGRLMHWVDARIVDGIVNGVGWGAIGAAQAIRRAQTGQVQLYAWSLLAGVVLLTLLVVAPPVLSGVGR
jgi:NADH-quinone oxidoreductase subunit L